MTKKQKLIAFIKNNQLEFTAGRRNSDLVVLCGYGLFIGATKGIVHSSIPVKLRTSDLEEELGRVYAYAHSHDYGKWWKDDKAKELYKF